MKNKKYSENEYKKNAVLKCQDQELKSIKFDLSEADRCIDSSEKLLKALGYKPQKNNCSKGNGKPKEIVIPTWEELCKEAENHVGTHCRLEELFTEDELKNNSKYLKELDESFKAVHTLDKYDLTIAAVAGLVSAATDILLVGIPVKTYDGVKAGPLSNYIRDYFDKVFPAEKMQELADSPLSKVPYDAQDNRHTTQYVEGMSAYYHRLLSLGHDPFLGFFVGVFDILTGRMTTIDKAGKIVSQVMPNYAARKESNLFAALAKQITHFKSDVTTSMGLPVPLMSLFNLLQFGSIGEEEQTIAEIVQGMYFEGYDFIHFCSMSVPVMLTEVIVRLGYAVKRIKEGHSIKESLPVSLNREKNPKLASMLFLAHSISTAVNAGKLYFTGNPLAINYSQWMAFAFYSFSQLKWEITGKENARHNFVMETLNKGFYNALNSTDKLFKDFSDNYEIIFK